MGITARASKLRFDLGCGDVRNGRRLTPMSTFSDSQAPAAIPDNPYRHIEAHSHLHGTFGEDRFAAIAEKIALFFGTPTYIVVQTVIVLMWVSLNAIGVAFAWDKYPFVFLNLAFSLQAAYAAPLILLAQTRSAEREKHAEEAAAIGTRSPDRTSTCFTRSRP